MEPAAKKRRYLKGMVLVEVDKDSVAHPELDPNEDSQVLVGVADPLVLEEKQQEGQELEEN